MSVFTQVEEFNREVIGIDRKEAIELDGDEFSWLLSALNEEIGELALAQKQHDFVGQIDAIMDLVYFAAGALTRMGIGAQTAENIFNVIHPCNMQKRKGLKKEREVANELDAVKPEDWSDPSAAIMDILNELQRG